jgi:hypothetical protein
MEGDETACKCSMVGKGKSKYTVIHKSVKHFKNSQQIDYATDGGNSYTDRERNSPSFFKEKLAHIIALICR